MSRFKEILEQHANWLNGKGNGNRADLKGEDLSGVNLSGANLKYADLSGSDLSDANLNGADLRHADINGADLRHADLRHANFRRANLNYAILDESDLRSADLTRADLSDTDMFDAVLDDIELYGANTHRIFGIKILSVDNIGTFGGKVTFIPDLDMVFAGCWKGSLEEFLKVGLEENEENKTEKRNIELVYEFFKNNVESVDNE